MIVPIKNKGFLFTYLRIAEYMNERCPFLRIEKVTCGVPITATAILYWDFKEPDYRHGGGTAKDYKPVSNFYLMEVQIKEKHSLEVLHTFLDELSKFDLSGGLEHIGKWCGYYNYKIKMGQLRLADPADLE